MAKVYSPNKKYNGETATVSFRDGVGETNNKYLIEYLKSKGYTIEETKEIVDEELEKLKKEAQKLGIKYNANIGKEKLKERIEEQKKLQEGKEQTDINSKKQENEDNDGDNDIDPFED